MPLDRNKFNASIKQFVEAMKLKKRLAAMPPPIRPINRPPTGSQPAFTFSKGVKRSAFKLGLFGPEGIGKSSLMALCPGIKVIDTEMSTLDMDIERVEGVRVARDEAQSWLNLRRFIQTCPTGIYGIDSMTRAEDWCAVHLIKTKVGNDGKATDSLEDFKYKAGITFLLDEFRRFLGDIDNAFSRGCSFIMVAHSRIRITKNPDASDFIRYEPRLVDDDKKGSNMLQWAQFLDHLALLIMDINVDKNRKAQGGGCTIYMDTAPNRMCKTRSLDRTPMEFIKGKIPINGGVGFYEALGVK